MTEVVLDTFTRNPLCWHRECQWEVPSGGITGIEARYKDSEGRPVCWEHYKESQNGDGESKEE